ncbi:hypothetical protein B0O80DRAFT_531967 [Mortierella sp. GBAus27b]|nr:hypothetical protein B0O80DRAFT_531967 [Mortierella sp. GBAus27b]
MLKPSAPINRTPLPLAPSSKGLVANASSIEVRINVAAHNLRVSDNGTGITAVDMGVVRARHATSKYPTQKDSGRITTYDFRGEDMSFIDLVSRPQNQDAAYCAIFNGGKRIFYGPSSGSPPASLLGTAVKPPCLSGTCYTRCLFARNASPRRRLPRMIRKWTRSRGLLKPRHWPHPASRSLPSTLPRTPKS